MNADLRKLFERVQTWPESDQAELAELAEFIEVRHRGEYRATAEELRAIDDADRSGVASEQDVEAAFKTFRG
ncbi:MAG: hypothetical protein V7604_947 [Hyphomicrobiales bacterium]|jgi:hypothetical protein